MVLQLKDENWSGFETICKQGIFVKTDLTIKCQKGEKKKYNGYHTQIIIFIHFEEGLERKNLKRYHASLQF